MSLLPEENNELQAESTIFTASPTKVEPKKPKKQRKMLKSILASLLAVFLLGGSIFAVVKFIPKKEEAGIASTENIPVISIAPEKVQSIKITRADSVSTYISAVEDVKNEDTGETEKKVSWSIKGVSPELTETTAISMITDTVLSLRATRTVEREEGADYGFSKPSFLIEITGYDAADNLTLTIGSETPSGSGIYAEVKDTIYLISADAAADFAKTDEQLATSHAIPAATIDGDTLDYFEDDKLARFDKITLSGKNFPQKLTFVMNEKAGSGNYNDYVMTTPYHRYADSENVALLFEVAIGGLTAAEAYKYNPTAADLAKFRLSSPDMRLSIEYGGKKVAFSASRYDDEYFAVLVDGKEDIIFKVANSFLLFAEIPDTTFANRLTFIELLTDFKKMTFKTAKDTYNFDIDYTAKTDDTDEVLKIKANGKEIEAQNFQNFYQHMVVECNEVTLKRESGTPVLTVSATDGSKTSSIKFIKYSERRYYVEVDSAPIGFISATNMEKILTYLADAAEGREVPPMA